MIRIFTFILLLHNIIADDFISDIVDVKTVNKSIDDNLEGMITDSMEAEDESEEEYVTEMEDFTTMTTPITTPKTVKLETSTQSIVKPDIDNSLESNDNARDGLDDIETLETNDAFNEVETGDEEYNEVVEEPKSFNYNNNNGWGWYYFSGNEPKLVNLYHSTQQFPSFTSYNTEPASETSYPFFWSLPQHWAAKPDQQHSNTLLPSYPVLYYYNYNNNNV